MLSITILTTTVRFMQNYQQAYSSDALLESGSSSSVAAGGEGILVEGEPTWERMGKLAGLCIAAVERHFGELLDFTPESFQILDRVLTSGWGTRSESIDPNVVATVGAYVGEMITRRTSGRWVSGVTDDEPGSILYLDRNDEVLLTISPFLFVRQKLEHPYEYDMSVAWAALEQRVRELTSR